MWRLFRSEPRNPVIAELKWHRRRFDPRMSQILTRLPKLSQTFAQGRDYLYDLGIYEVFREYDTRAGSEIARRIDAVQKAALLDEIAAVMLYTFHRTCTVRYPESPECVARLTDALHFEMYRRLPTPDAGVLAYLTYRNPHFEDPTVAYAFHFGQRVGTIMATLDTPFLLMLAQHAPLIVEIAEHLIRSVLFNEPIAAAPSTEGSDSNRTRGMS